MSWLALIIHSVALYAQTLSPIVIQGSKGNFNSESSSSVISTLENQNIDSTNSYLIEDMSQLSGLNVIQTGGLGGSTSIFSRGLNSKYTTVYLNGVKLNDPMDPNRRVDISFLSNLAVERIEYIKGPQSVLYGSDAIGGVINIIPLKNKTMNQIQASSGSFETNRLSLATSKDGRDSYFQMIASATESHGYSAASEGYGGVENDGHKSYELMVMYDYQLYSSLLWESFVRLNSAESDIDEGFGVSRDDQNKRIEKDDLQVSTKLTKSFDSEWQMAHILTLNQIKRREYDGLDSVDVTVTDDIFQGTNGQWEMHFKKNKEVIIGASIEREEGSSNQFAESFNVVTTSIFYSQQLIINPKLYMDYGGRVFYHEIFQEDFIYNLGFKYFIAKNFDLSFRYGTSFKSPSLYEIYGPFGNVQLIPEKGSSYEFSLHTMTSQTQHRLSFYHNEIEDEIQWVSSQYVNVDGELTTQGFEWENEIKLNNNLSSYLNYNRNSSKQAQGLAVRRPDHKWNLGLDYDYNNFKVVFEGEYQSHRYDGSSPSYVTLDSFNVFNTAFKYLASNTEYSFQIKNIFNRNYELVQGYSVAPLSAYFSVKTQY